MTAQFRSVRGVVCFALAAVAFAARSSRSAGPHCAFDDASYSFSGTPQEQARCLLSPVLIKGGIGAPLAKLPEPLDSLVGQPVAVTKEELRQYLRERGIAAEDIGGSLDEPLSRANTNDERAPQATYFVIHDTSMPNLLLTAREFPPDINSASWV